MKVFRTHAFPVSEIPPFGNIDLGIPVSQFFMMGFRPGDAVDVEFSNGFAFRNIPVFSGFYGSGHTPCLYAASKLYPNIGIGCPVSGNPWIIAGANAGDTARIALRRRRGFKQLEDRMRLPALLGPAPARTPQQNANWRSLAAGKIAPGTIFRSCSPIRSDSVAPAIACELIEETGIRSVLNLSDNPAMLQARKKDADAHTAPYLRLYDEGQVLPLHIGTDYRLKEYARTLAHGLLWLADQPKPSLIHCKLGLDRTGMVCILLEMLAGCSYAEIERDYRTSYFNLFGHPSRNRQGYPLCNLRFKELIDFLLSFARETGNHENIPSTKASVEGMQDGTRNSVQSDAQNHPDTESLRFAARAYLAFGEASEEQIDRIESMLEGKCAGHEGAPR